MVRSLAKVVLLAILVVAGAFGIDFYRKHFSAEQQIEELKQQKRQLQQIVQRLSDERRVADVLVTDHKEVNGIEQTTLLFVEYARDGSTTLPPKSFTIEGHQAHIDAMVIKFEHGFVEQNDALRGHSIALFTKLYGDRQSPDKAFMIDTPGKVPDFYRGSDPRIEPFEKELWANFWRLYDDPEYRQEKGVRVAEGQGVWGPFEADKLYTITVESNGGLNITNEPLKGIYREALKQHAAGEHAGSGESPGNGGV
jgi:hypothetical protein